MSPSHLYSLASIIGRNTLPFLLPSTRQIRLITFKHILISVHLLHFCWFSNPFLLPADSKLFCRSVSKVPAHSLLHENERQEEVMIISLVATTYFPANYRGSLRGLFLLFFLHPSSLHSLSMGAL